MAERHGCPCLDLPRMHARGDAGCEHESAPTAPKAGAGEVARREARQSQHQAWREATGTDLSELR